MIQFLVFTAIVLALVSCHHQPSSMAQLKQQLDQKIAESGVTVAIAFEDLKTGDAFAINDKVVMHAASTMKTPVMIEVFKQASLGKFSLSDTLVLKNDFKSIVDGSSFAMEIDESSDTEMAKLMGQPVSIQRYIHEMITLSSNLSTNMLVDLVGAKQVMATMQEMGAHRIQVLRGVDDIKAYDKGMNNTTDAADMLLIMKTIALKKVVSEKACDEMIAILADQKHRENIPALLPPDVKIANKTGTIPGVINHDAAIIYKTPDHPYVLVVMTQGIQDNQKAEQLIAEISKMIFDEVK